MALLHSCTSFRSSYLAGPVPGRRAGIVADSLEIGVLQPPGPSSSGDTRGGFQGTPAGATGPGAVASGSWPEVVPTPVPPEIGYLPLRQTPLLKAAAHEPRPSRGALSG